MHCVTHTYPWAIAQWAAARPSRRLVVLAGFASEELAFAFPLLVPASGRVVSIEAATELEPFWCGIDPELAFDSLRRYLDASAPRWCRISFPMVAASAADIAPAVSAGFDATFMPTHDSPRLELLGAEDTYWQTRSDRVKVARRRRSELESLGTLRVRALADAADAERAIAAILEIEQESWKYERESDMTSRQNQHVFYAVLTRQLLARKWLAVNLLEFNDEPVAYEFDVLYDGVALSLKHSYKARFHLVAPGIVLREASLRRYREAGCASVDFWGSSDSFKCLWTSETRTHGTLLLERPTAAVGRTRAKNRLRSRVTQGPVVALAREALIGPADRDKFKNPSKGLLGRLGAGLTVRPRLSSVSMPREVPAASADGLQVVHLGQDARRMRLAQLVSGVRSLPEWIAQAGDAVAPCLGVWRADHLLAFIATTASEGEFIDVRATYVAPGGRVAVPALLAAFAAETRGRRIRQLRPSAGAPGAIDVIEAFAGV